MQKKNMGRVSAFGRGHVQAKYSTYQVLIKFIGEKIRCLLYYYLLKDEGIVRHRGKIEAVINNALRAQELVKREGSLAAFVWRYEPDKKQFAKPQTASTSEESLALSKDLKKLGWKFVGPTTAYAFMQAMGLINDHVEGCLIRAKLSTRARISGDRGVDRCTKLFRCYRKQSADVEALPIKLDAHHISVSNQCYAQKCG